MDKLATASCLAYISRGKLNEFFGYVTDLETGETIFEEGEWSDLDAALAWARERADQVILTYGTGGDSVFSAGVTYCDAGRDEGLKIWPPCEEVLKAMDADVLRHEDRFKQSDPSRLGVAQPMIIRGDKPRRPSREDKGSQA